MIFSIQPGLFLAFEPQLDGFLSGGSTKSLSRLLSLVFLASVLVVSMTLGPTALLVNKIGLGLFTILLMRA
jgi:hypothetical protein